MSNEEQFSLTGGQGWALSTHRDNFSIVKTLQNGN